MFFLIEPITILLTEFIFELKAKHLTKGVFSSLIGCLSEPLGALIPITFNYLQALVDLLFDSNLMTPCC